MIFFSKPEVVILKESSDAKKYLSKLEELYKEIPPKSELAQKIEKEIVITKTGIIGEDQIMFELKNSDMDLVVLHDIYIEDKDGNGAQIDYLVITPYVNVFIECKNLFGNIEINNKGDFIRVIELGKRCIKEGIYSPISQNERHLRVFKKCGRASKGRLFGALWEASFEKYNKSLVVLANPKTIVNDKYAKAEIKKQVIRADQLIAKLREYKSDLKSSPKEQKVIGEEILAMNIEERKDYFTKFEVLKKEYEAEWNDERAEVLSNTVEEKLIEQKESKQKQVAQETTTEIKPLICPRCGSQLILRTAKKGDNAGKQFYGCGSFPKCRYVKELE